jgi:predicted phage terminase large subunit-like protein
LIENNAREVLIENNNGGRSFFARSIERLFKEQNKNIVVSSFHEVKNKETRILVESANVNKYIIMPVNWKLLFPAPAESLLTYSRIGKNRNDDIEDAITGLVEHMVKNNYSITTQDLEKLRIDKKGVKF